MGCKNLFPDGGGFGFVCTCDGYKPKPEELVNTEETIIKQDLENYKNEFIEYVINYCRRHYTKEDEKWFKAAAESEVEAHIESVGLNNLNYDNPEDDAEECLSYWSY